MRISVCLLLLASLAPAAEPTYSIQLNRPVTVGQRWWVMSESQLSSRSVMKIGAESKPMPGFDLGLNLSGTVEVVEVDKNGREQKLKYTNDVGFITLNGARSEEVAKGLVVIVTADKGGGKFTAEKGELSQLMQSALPLAFQLKTSQSPTDDEMLGTKEAMKVGASWKINSEAVAKDIEVSGNKAAAADISGQVKLDRVEKVSDIQCMRLVARIEIANLTAPEGQQGSLPAGFKHERARIVASVRGLLPVDPTKPRIFDAEETTFTTIARGKQDGADATIETTFRRTREATYRAK